MPALENSSNLLAAVADGALVLTVNKRLTRSIRARYDAWMMASEKGAWQTPQVFSFDAWLHSTLAASGDDARLLGGLAAQRLWEQVIEKDVEETGQGLLQVAATARRAQEAHQLLSEYGGSPQDLPLSEDHQAFLRWRAGYLEACRKGEWCESVELGERIAKAIAAGRVTVPRQVLLAGFDEITPRIMAMAEAMRSAGAEVREVPPVTEPQGELLRFQSTDREDEVRSAARWARALIEKGKKNIGIIVTDLTGYRPLVERIFREEIDPGSVTRLDEEVERFSLSLGAPLAEQGPVVAALEILGLGYRPSIDAIGFLLRTPYLGGSQREAWPRARFDQKLRSFGKTAIGLKRLCELLEPTPGSEGALEEFTRICRGLETNLKDNRRRFPGEWVRQFSHQLGAAGWPGERPLGSVEYQVVKGWKEKLLPAMVALEAVTGTIDRSEALSLLQRIAKDIDFQPETPSGPLQVLGLLEASGLAFDHLWVMGLSEEALPAPPRPNPFIPVPVQVERRMPHASAARELEFSRRVAKRLFAGAPQVILSHPGKDGDLELRPSPLISRIVQCDRNRLALAESHAPLAVIRRQLPAQEELVDELGAPAAEGEKASGGTSLLKDQALCPFRAYARHRLGARALDQPEIGLDPLTRGTLLHACLEAFWSRTVDLQGLLTLDGEALYGRVRESVEQALKGHFDLQAEEVDRPMLAIEAERLTALVLEWLDEVEKKRSDFAVDAVEVERTGTFGGVTIGTKVDRIDTLVDGSRVIIDYKTGQIHADDLLSDRLLEPQLPVYSCSETGAELAAVVFAGVRRGACRVQGVAREKGLLPKIEAFDVSKQAQKHGIPDWTSLLARWRAQLEALGGEFASGQARVDPVDVAKACLYCDLSGLCRINEFAPFEEESE